MNKPTEFHRVAIVNRGEAAMRLIHAARELGNEGPSRLRTVALYADPDRHAMFVREADDAVSLGAAIVVEDGQSKSAYRDLAGLERALVAAKADAAWVGWGSAASCAEVAALCARRNIVFIGPKAAVIARLSDEATVKQIAEKAGLRLASSPRLSGARRIEVQVLADHHGTVWAAGVRDSTLQRRNHRVIDETPSPVLTQGEDASVRAMAVEFARVAEVDSAATVQFIFDLETRTFSFTGAQAGLTVESSGIEATTGLDLVKLQIHIARGGKLEGEPPALRGHAIKVRLSAEDPENDFAKGTGRLELLRLPTGPGLRVDRGLTEGDELSAEFEPMIAKVIAWGSNREEALSRLRRALVEGAVAVRGGTSNKAFLVSLLARPEVAGATADAAFIDELTACGAHISRDHAEVALLDAAIEAYSTELAGERSEFFATAARGRPQVRPEARRAVELKLRDQAYRFQVQQLGPCDYRIDGGGGSVDVRVDAIGPFERRLTFGEQRFHVFATTQGDSRLVEVEGISHRVHLDPAGMVRAPTPAMVLSIPVSPGSVVSAGDRLAVLETMKMELAVVAPFAGRVREVLVNTNVQVHAGAPLVLLEPAGSAGPGSSPTPVRFGEKGKSAPPTEVRARWVRALSDVKRLLLGFDIDAAEAKRLAGSWAELSLALPEGDTELLRAEQALVLAFADVHSLFRRQPPTDEPVGPEGPETAEDRSAHEYFVNYLRATDTRGEGLPAGFLGKLTRALSHYGVTGTDRTPELEDALVRIYKSHGRGEQQAAIVASILDRWRISLQTPSGVAGDELNRLLARLVSVVQGRFAAVVDLAREVRYRSFDQPVFERGREAVYARMDECLAELAKDPMGTAGRAEHIGTLVECPQPLVPFLLGRFEGGSPALRALMLEVLTRRYYRIRPLQGIHCRTIASFSVALSEYDHEGRHVHVIATYSRREQIAEAVTALHGILAELPADHDVVLDLFVFSGDGLGDADASERDLRATIERISLPRALRRLSVVVGGHTVNSRPMLEMRRLVQVQHFTYRPAEGSLAEDKLYRGLHPMMGKRVHLWSLSNFNIERLPSVEDVFLFRAVAKSNPKDERLIGVAEVRDVTAVRDADGHVVSVPHLERMLFETLAAIRVVQAKRASHERLQYNRVLLYVWPPLSFSPTDLDDVVKRLAPATEGLGIEQVAVRARVVDEQTSELRDVVIRASSTVGQGLRVTVSEPSDTPMQALSEYQQKVSQLRRRGLVYPYEIVKLLTPERDSQSGDFPRGEFTEYDVDPVSGKLAPVDRPFGKNSANIVVGVIKSFTKLYPEGMKRVIMLGDPSKEMGSVAEPECRRIALALDLAEELNVPAEWFTHCAGAKISMESGTENMDWVSIVLRRLIEFTQAGREVNVVVCGINVGAQPYWNAEATMLMHTRGILVMTPDAAMVLTGKQSLDYSGSVSAEDNQGIGGYDRIMGPNGQAQYFATDIAEACKVLMAHYDHAYVVPGERFPRRATTTDPFDRDVRLSPHPATDDFTLVGDVFSDEKNPGRKKPFEIRAIMAAVADRDHRPLERWRDMRDAGTAVIWDAHIGGFPVCVVGMESHPLRRLGYVPADGPEQLTSGTLYPQASKKVARSINSASNNRPLVVLANLSGFDGSPEAMRTLQLEYGAEIGRAVTNFVGPIVFCVVSRYHGGAFVVFSKKLNENIEAIALEGTFASVIGGAPAAAVVFTREVDGRTNKDPRIVSLQDEIAKATGDQKRRLNEKLAELRPVVRSEKLGTVADEFDQVHSVHRALKTGSLDRIIPAVTMRPYIIEALERGIKRTLAQKK